MVYIDYSFVLTKTLFLSLRKFILVLSIIRHLVPPLYNFNRLPETHWIFMRICEAYTNSISIIANSVHTYGKKYGNNIQSQIKIFLTVWYRKGRSIKKTIGRYLLKMNLIDAITYQSIMKINRYKYNQKTETCYCHYLRFCCVHLCDNNIGNQYH